MYRPAKTMKMTKTMTMTITGGKRYIDEQSV